MRRTILLLCLSMLVSSVAFADPQEEKAKKGNPADQAVLDLDAPLTDDARTRADGNIEDWNEEKNKGVAFSTLLSGEYEYDWTGEKDLSGNVRAQYGEERIYFLITVKDNAIVSKHKQWGGDKVELWLEPESADGKSLGAKRGIIIDVGGQKDGKANVIKWNSGKPVGLEGSVYIDQGGYDIEVSADYYAFGKEQPVKDGFMRYCVLVRDWDQDDENEDEAAIGTCPINPKNSSSLKTANMGKIKLSLGEAMWKQIMQNKHLAAIEADWAKLDVDLAGTTLKETVAFGGDTLIVAGVGLNGSPTLSYKKLSIEAGPQKEAPQLTVKDVDGDKKPEILMTRTEQCTNGDMVADRTYVFKYDPSEIRLLANYVTEQRYTDGTEGFIRNNYKLSKAGIAQTLDKSSTKGMPECILKGSLEMVPILTPDSEKKTAKHPYL
ncbi:MAG: hypothetical protein IJU23_03135 [Proteobacteria bacterium]|nr:hypothetical protein [Pseudomonadota bacterium]